MASRLAGKPVVTVVAFRMHDGPKPTASDEVAQRADRGHQPEMLADADRDARAGAGGERGRGIRRGERERLFAIDVPACLGRGLDLHAVPAVRRSQHDCLDRRIGEGLFIVRADRKLVLEGKFTRQIGFERNAAREADELGALRRLDEPPAPPAEPDDRGI